MCDNLDRNFDQSAKTLNKCIEEAIESLDSNQSTRTSLERALDTFLVCLKSEHNIIRLFNRICTQTLVNLIKLITKLNDKDVSEKAWKTLKISLFSKSHGNVYTEFVKNLPQSFVPNSNYQVAVLFNTLKNESVSNISAISGVFHLITKEILSVLNNDYKHKMQFVIFMADLLWGLMDSSENKLVVKSITNLLKVVEESNLFNPTTDQFNGGIFKSFLKSFLKKSFVCEFDEEYSELLVQLMRLDHLLLEQDLGLIVRKTENNENLEKVLSAYLEESVKYRQLPRMTKNLIDVLKTDTTLPSKFYTKYGEYLESYQVDSQSILDIWKVANSTLETNNRCGETLELLNTLLNRVNLIQLPLNLKPESIELLKQTESLIFDYLTKLKSESIMKGSNIVSKYLNCCFSCGFLYIILCRFSLSSNNDCLSTSANSLANVNRFLSVLYNEFKLDDKLNLSKIDLGKCNLNNLFYMNKLQLLNIHAFGIDGVVKIGRKVEETLLNEMFSIDLKAAKKIDFSSVFDDFNLESKIEDQEAYKLLHNKILVLDNLHVIIPLIKNETKALDNCFKNLLAVVYLADKNQMHPINRETIFNDFVVCKEFETAFLKFLIELNLNDKSQGKVFLEMLESFLKNKNSKDSIDRLCEFKNDFYLTKNQTKAFIKISTYFQIEHLSVKQSIMMFLLAERIKLDDETENFVLSIYFQLFKNDFFKHIPLSKFETWIFKFLADFSSNEKHPKDLIFEKIVRKAVAFLLRQQNVENMKTFLNKIITENRKLNDSDQKQMINQVLIHIVERISKILSVQSTDSTYLTDLKSLLELITAHFTADQPIRTDNEKFLLCSILIRHRDLFPNKIEDYFKTLFNDCQKLHKKHRKSVKSVSASYIEFLKSTMLYKNEQFETAFESMFELYLNNETVIITDEFDKKESGQLVKTFTYIIKSLSTQQFEIVSGLFVKRIGLLYETGYLVKLADLFKLLCKDYELNDELKGIFSSFLQKIFLVQLPTIIGQLNSDNEISSLFKLLNAVNDIYGSKYFLFPSHLVISTLQSYSLLEFENYKIEHASEINQLLCRLLSVIMARYSKKFRNSTGVVTSILIKLINSTINVSNQLNLTDENVHLAVRMAKNLERIVAQLSPFKKFFVKQSPYILSEYFYKMSSLSVSNSVKPALTEMVFNLMHVCDLHGVSMLNVTLPNGPKELFKSAFVEYKRFFKYTGKV